MTDPTSDVGVVDEEDAPTCEHCDDPIVLSADHRVVPRVEDGEVRHRHFCDEECLGSFQE